MLLLVSQSYWLPSFFLTIPLFLDFESIRLYACTHPVFGTLCACYHLPNSVLSTLYSPISLCLFFISPPRFLHLFFCLPFTIVLFMSAYLFIALFPSSPCLLLPSHASFLSDLFRFLRLKDFPVYLYPHFSVSQLGQLFITISVILSLTIFVWRSFHLVSYPSTDFSIRLYLRYSVW